MGRQSFNLHPSDWRPFCYAGGDMNTSSMFGLLLKRPISFSLLAITALATASTGCKSSKVAAPQTSAAAPTTAAKTVTPQETAVAPTVANTVTPATNLDPSKPESRRFLYTPKPYPVDERGFSPVDKALAKY